MSLIPEWRRRIDHWQKTLESLLYRPIGELELAGAATTDYLTLSQARRLKFRPMPAGTKWGAKWQYAWFKTKVRLPAEARGKRIILRTATGGECAVFVDGKAAGTQAWAPREILLARSGVPGTTCDVLIEAYAGHGPQECGGGPCPHGVETVPEPPAKQRQVGLSTFGVWDEEAYQLWLDVNTLLELRDCIDPNSMRVMEVDKALRDHSVIFDPELPRPEMMKTVRAARRRLRPLLGCRNGPTTPRMYCFGHAHIDVAWLWPLQETERKTCRTFSAQLRMLEKYPDYRFLQSQPHLYRMLQTKYPNVYADVKRAVKRGRIIAEGGMWVEADTNVTGGESLIRQFMHGKRFFREEFGVESEFLWLPDVFGYSASLPQIMAGCGVKYFSTSKIFWNYNEGAPFPYNTFWWEGIDGTRTLSHFANNYNGRTSPRHVIDRWNNRVQKDGISSRMLPFGHGDGGGGPCREHVEYALRGRDLEGMPRMAIASPIDFFRDQENDADALPAYVGELYLQLHRGTYTSQARTKRGNRKCEYALRDAEMWGAAASVLAGYRYPHALIDECWKTVLLNQFHDILPGSSIARVYKEAEAMHADVVRRSHSASDAARRRLTRRNRRAMTVFNSLAWPRRDIVRLPGHFQGASDSDGRALPVQKINGSLFTEIGDIPSCGWTTVIEGPPAATDSVLRATSRSLENEHLRVRFNDRGEITSLYDKSIRRELAAGTCNRFAMYKDVPSQFDAWDIDITYKSCPVPLAGKARMSVRDHGPLVASIEIERTINGSHLRQIASLRRGARCLRFDTTVDWRESHKLLKVNFPVDVRSDEAIHEIQFGHLSRPTHASRQYDADRFEVCAHKWTALSEQNRGCALLNDSKYGVSVEDNSINLTLLKSALAPDMAADKGIQEFAYAFYAWNGTFGQSDIIREAYELNVPVTTAPGSAGTRSLFSMDCRNVVIEAAKPADDRSGDVVVRLYESKRMSTDCVMSTSLPVKSAALTNMLEEHPKKLRVTRSGSMRLSFRPFEIKTVRMVIGRESEVGSQGSLPKGSLRK